jgi:hypothetical protein
MFRLLVGNGNMDESFATGISGVEDHVPWRGVATALLSRVGCPVRLPEAAG